MRRSTQAIRTEMRGLRNRRQSSVCTATIQRPGGRLWVIHVAPTGREPSPNVRFSNRPFRVKRLQTIHRCSVDIARGFVLLFGIDTKAVPSWDSKTRWNNLCRGLAVTVTAGPSGHTNSPHPSSRSAEVALQLCEYIHSGGRFIRCYSVALEQHLLVMVEAAHSVSDHGLVLSVDTTPRAITRHAAPRARLILMRQQACVCDPAPVICCSAPDFRQHRLQADERRPGHANHPGLPGPPVDCLDGALYNASPDRFGVFRKTRAPQRPAPCRPRPSSALAPTSARKWGRNHEENNLSVAEGRSKRTELRDEPARAGVH